MDNKQDESKTKERGVLYELITVVLQAFIVVYVFMTFLFQPFLIPSGSMRPTMLVGDYFVANKFSYGYSTYSFPGTFHLFSGRFFAKEPKRGDVVVFRLPSDPSQIYIKRLIGLPGDKVQLIDGVVYINNQPVKREKIGQINNADITEISAPVDLYKETLPNGVSYNTLDIFPASPANNTRVFEVPMGSYFMLGDNRDNSLDSRFDVGYVPFENLIGKASLIVGSFSDGAMLWQFWRWPFTFRGWRSLHWISNILYDNNGNLIHK